jgi:hypothetical protein
MNPEKAREVLGAVLGPNATLEVLQALGAWADAVTLYGRLITNNGIVETNNWGLIGCEAEGPGCVLDSTFGQLFRVYATPEEGVAAWWALLSKSPQAMAALESGQASEIAKAASAMHGFSGVGAEAELAQEIAASGNQIAKSLNEPPTIEGEPETPGDMKAAQIAAKATEAIPALDNPQGWATLIAWAWSATRLGNVNGQATNNWARTTVPKGADGVCPLGSVDDGRGCVKVYSTAEEGAKELAQRVSADPKAMNAIDKGDVSLLAEAMLASGTFGEGVYPTWGDWEILAPELQATLQRLSREPGLEAQYFPFLFPPSSLLPLPMIDTSIDPQSLTKEEPTKGASTGTIVLASVAMLAAGAGLVWLYERATGDVARG